MRAHNAATNRSKTVGAARALISAVIWSQGTREERCGEDYSENAERGAHECSEQEHRRPGYKAHSELDDRAHEWRNEHRSDHDGRAVEHQPECGKPHRDQELKPMPEGIAPVSFQHRAQAGFTR